MHLFPTTLAILECSSINSESQSRPLAVIAIAIIADDMIQHLSTRRDQIREKPTHQGRASRTGTLRPPPRNYSDRVEGVYQFPE
jgi:hypothetical protein